MQIKAIEFFELVCLQNVIIFNLDNKPISKVDVLLNAPSTIKICTFLASITLNPLVYLIANKQKYK